MNVGANHIYVNVTLLKIMNNVRQKYIIACVLIVTKGVKQKTTNAFVIMILSYADLKMMITYVHVNMILKVVDH